MDPKLVKAALEALKNDDGDAALALLEQALVAAADPEGAGDAGEPPADAGATAENADTPPADPNAPPAGDGKQEKEMAALSRELVTLSGRPDIGEALAYFRELHTEAAQRGADAVVLEAAERRGLVAELVRLGAETPATAWQRDDDGNIPEGDARQPVKRLAGEPVAEMRSRVTVLRASRGDTGPGPKPRTPPAGPSPKPLKPLTKAEREFCEREKLSPEQFQARKEAAVTRSK